MNTATYAIQETYKGFLCDLDPVLWEREAGLINDIHFFTSKKEANKMVVALRKQGYEVERISYEDI